MPLNLENIPPKWDDIEGECEHIPMNCLWTITSDDKILRVVITCLKWTFNYDFWMRVTAHPERNPSILKKIDIIEHNPFLEYISEAQNDYEDFPEPQLNSHQLHILGELLDSIF